MKEAFWALGLMVLGLFGLVLVNLFGDITTTNQQDYTLMKNSVEAAMYDAIDYASFSTGFCLCNISGKKQDGKWTFTSSSQYDIKEPTGDKECDYSGYANVEYMAAEYKIDKEVFAESLLRRFANTAKSNKSYQIVIQDVIEYPPKVSVKISSANNYNIFTAETSDNDFDIINDMSAILEDYTETKSASVPEDEPEEETEETPTPTPDPDDGDEDEPTVQHTGGTCHYYAEGTYGKYNKTTKITKYDPCYVDGPAGTCLFGVKTEVDSTYVAKSLVSYKTTGQYNTKQLALNACRQLYRNQGYDQGNDCTAYTIYRWSFNGVNNSTNYSSREKAAAACTSANEGKAGICQTRCV